jgi:hypothetical protein
LTSKILKELADKKPETEVSAGPETTYSYERDRRTSGAVLTRIEPKLAEPPF